MKPFFSVVIPTYNCANKIHRAIESVLSQSYKSFEVLVMDDGSTDNTEEIINSFRDKRILYDKDKNFGGPAKPRNRGIAKAKGDWICFLDADDWWHHHKLEFTLSEIEAGAEVIYHDMYLVRSLSQNIFKDKLISSQPKHPMFTSLLFSAMSLPNSSVVVKKECLKKIGKISEKKDLISVEDYDTWIRLSKVTEKFARIPRALGYYWSGGSNISIASPAQCNYIEFLYDQYMNELSSSQKKRARGFLAYRIARIAMSYGDRTKAQNLFLQAFCSPINLIFRIKSIYFLCANVMLRFYQ